MKQHDDGVEYECTTWSLQILVFTKTEVNRICNNDTNSWNNRLINWYYGTGIHWTLAWGLGWVWTQMFWKCERWIISSRPCLDSCSCCVGFGCMCVHFHFFFFFHASWTMFVMTWWNSFCGVAWGMLWNCVKVQPSTVVRTSICLPAEWFLWSAWWFVYLVMLLWVSLCRSFPSIPLCSIFH